METNRFRERSDAGELEAVRDEETAYLFRSEAMRRRLLEAKQRTEGIPFEEVRRRLGV